MSFVYVIQSGRDIVKIGKADDVGKRLRALQTAQPFRLRLVHQIEVNETDVLVLEKRIHKQLKGLRLQGEWFRIDPSQAIRVVDQQAAFIKRRTKRLTSSAKALQEHPGTITRHLYCPKCFHRGMAHVPHGASPQFKCSKCGERPLIGGKDKIRPWWDAMRARNRALQRLPPGEQPLDVEP